MDYLEHCLTLYKDAAEKTWQNFGNSSILSYFEYITTATDLGCIKDYKVKNFQENAVLAEKTWILF